MVRHAAFADSSPKATDVQVDRPTAQSEHSTSSLAPTGTRTTDPEKSSLAGLTHKTESAKAVRRLLLKLGQSFFPHTSVHTPAARGLIADSTGR